MAKLSSSDRKALPKSDFAGPDDSFPIPDKSHAIQALRERKFAPNPSAIVSKVHQKFPDVGKEATMRAVKGGK